MKTLRIVGLVSAVICFVLSVVTQNLHAALGWFTASTSIFSRILAENER